MLPLFYRLKATVCAFFSFRNACLQIFAWGATYAIVISGFDWAYFKYVQGSPIHVYLSPAVGIGGLVPIFGIPLLYFFAKLKKSLILNITTWALAQAAALGWIVSSTYKAFTGRVQPPHGIFDPLVDASRNWNFGFMEHGIFWGWPSSHTTVAFSMSFALIFLFQNNKKVFWLALVYALYIGLDISMQIHWFSEFVAGAIIGGSIGAIVGKSFRNKIRDTIVTQPN